ncbi:MAG: hypothetical protein ABIS86_02580 [Streptosporangiaceae bacterium]
MGETDRPEWASKPVGQLTAQEIADALEYLVEVDADEVLRRALARQLMSLTTVAA